MIRLARRWFSAASWCAVGLLSAPAFADNSAAVTGVAAGTAAVAAAAAATPAQLRSPTEVVGHELPEWVDPRTGSASRLASSCGLTLEARLSGMAKQNYLNLTVANDAEMLVLLDLQNVIARFGSGATRRLAQEGGGGDVTIRPDWSTHYTFVFPWKEEFEHETRLSVEVPLSFASGQTCLATVQLAHAPNAKVPERSYTTYSPLEMAFGLNAHFAATGGLHEIAKNANPGFDLAWTLYPWVHHGFTFEFGIDAFGRKGLPVVAPYREASPITGTFFMLGYSYRLLPVRRLAFEYNLNGGLYALESETPDGKDKVASSVCFGVREKLKLNVLVYESTDHTRLEVGPGLVHSYIPAGDFGATNASGNLFSAGLFVTVD